MLAADHLLLEAHPSLGVGVLPFELAEHAAGSKARSQVSPGSDPPLELPGPDPGSLTCFHFLLILL